MNLYYFKEPMKSRQIWNLPIIYLDEYALNLQKILLTYLIILNIQSLITY